MLPSAKREGSHGWAPWRSKDGSYGPWMEACSMHVSLEFSVALDNVGWQAVVRLLLQ